MPLVAALLSGVIATSTATLAPQLAVPPLADVPPGPTWSPEWRRFSTEQYAVTGAMTVAQLLLFLAVSSADQPNWRGGILFDDAIRDALRAPTYDARLTVSLVSDPMYFTILAYPVIVDALLVAGLIHGSGDVALQLAMISLQSQLASGIIAVGTQKGIARERPAGRTCREDPSSGPNCAAGVPPVSFIGGHVAIASTAATLICVHHARLPLYGGGWGDTAACAGGIAVTGAIAVMRMVAEAHYATDILAGLTVGVLAGYLLPELLHYGWSEGAHSVLVLPSASEGAVGLRVLGAF